MYDRALCYSCDNLEERRSRLDTIILVSGRDQLKWCSEVGEGWRLGFPNVLRVRAEAPWDSPLLLRCYWMPEAYGWMEGPPASGTKRPELGGSEDTGGLGAGHYIWVMICMGLFDRRQDNRLLLEKMSLKFEIGVIFLPFVFRPRTLNIRATEPWNFSCCWLMSGWLIIKPLFFMISLQKSRLTWQVLPIPGPALKPGFPFLKCAQPDLRYGTTQNPWEETESLSDSTSYWCKTFSEVRLAGAVNVPASLVHSNLLPEFLETICGRFAMEFSRLTVICNFNLPSLGWASEAVEDLMAAMAAMGLPYVIHGLT